MGHVEVAGLAMVLPDGRRLFDEVSFRVGEGTVAALVGANGTGKTTLLRIIAGDLRPNAGTAVSSGGLGVMRQFIGSVRDERTVADLLLELAPPAVRVAAAAVESAELALMNDDTERNQMRYAEVLTAWGDAGGYDAEVLWDTVTTAALRQAYDLARFRPLRELSGGEQKRLALEALLRGPDEVLLLDEPDNYLDVPAKRWLEQRLATAGKTVLFVSHDRELLANSATTVITLEGHQSWTHGGGFGGYHTARVQRQQRLAELHRRWDEEHHRLKELVRTLQQQAAISPDMASRYRAMQTRLAKFEAAGRPPEVAVEQDVRMRLTGGRTGLRALICEQASVPGLLEPFDLEVFYGERVAVLGPNGAGKSHLLRMVAGAGSEIGLSCRLGARVVPGMFAQTHEHPELIGRTLVEVLWRGEGGRPGRDRGAAISALRRYELYAQADQTFDSLSGGQQARFLILLLELSGCTMLLLDEPTDNLDLHSAEALENGLAGFSGTVLAVTHDRWFAKTFDRFVNVGHDGTVRETDGPLWE